MEATEAAIEIIKSEETLQLEAYQDGTSISIGYGHSNKSGGKKFKLGDTITEEEALALLEEDVAEAVRIVNQRMKNYDVIFNQGQFDGMVIATFNRPNNVKSEKLYKTVASGDMEAIKTAWQNTISEQDRKDYPGLERRLDSELNTMEEIDEDRGIPVPEEGFVPFPLPLSSSQDDKEVTIPQNKMQEFQSQVPIAAQMKFVNQAQAQSYARVKQMLEAQVNKQKKAAGHTPVNSVVPKPTLSEGIEAALKLLGR